MEITREVVNQWLDRTRRSRDWLASQCGVGVAAVGMWLNRKGTARPIPAQHIITICELMERDAEAQADENTLRITFSDEDFATIERAARIVDTPLKDFVSRAAVHQAKERLTKYRSAPSSLRAVAEEAPAYKTKRTGTRDERGE